MRKSPPSFTEEHRRKIGNANKISLKGRKLSDEHKRHISEYNKRVGRIPHSEYWFINGKITRIRFLNLKRADALLFKNVWVCGLPD